MHGVGRETYKRDITFAYESRPPMSADFATARENMLDSQVRTQDVTDLNIIDAMRAVAREEVVPVGRAFQAYADLEVEYAPGRSLLKPRDIAKALQTLKPKRGEKALAIAAPYGARVLEAMGLDVAVANGDDLTALPGGGYDVILVEGAVSETPAAWTAALGPGGRLVVVEREAQVGRLMLYQRSEDGVGKRPVFDATPPYLAGFEPKVRFAF